MNASFHLFDVRIDSLRDETALKETLEEFLRSEKTNIIFTPNPEILLVAHKNSNFLETLNAAGLSLPDGFGVSLIHFIRTGRWIRRYPGIDTAELLLRIANTENLAVVLLGGKKGAATRAAKRLREKMPSLRVAAAGEDICFRSDGTTCDPENEQRLANTINDHAPAILFVGLGAPKQENWVMRHKNDFPSVRIMMTVGGAFDIWSGRLSRASKIMRAVGLEWLWRLIQEPKRTRRIFRATILFPWYILKEKPRR